MKILFLSKRLYMSHDLLQHRYGRFYEIPAALARAGHWVELVSLAYHYAPPIDALRDGRLHVQSYKLGLNPLHGFLQHYRRLDELVEQFSPDVIIAASDCYHIIIGAGLSRRHGVPLIADLYDNFRAYGASHVPGILPWFYRSLTHAQVITAISTNLKNYLREKSADLPPIQVVGNAVAGMFLTAHDREAARRHFRFTPDATYIGTAGDLGEQRGIDSLVRAFLDLASTDNRMHLVLAGQPGKKLARIEHPNLHLLGRLEHVDIPQLFSALDVGVISLRNDIFGRYCFPQKYYEMVACGLPLIAAAVGEMETLLAEHLQLLYRPEDVEDLKRVLHHQLEHRTTLPVVVPTWQDQARKFEQIAHQVTGGKG